MTEQNVTSALSRMNLSDNSDTDSVIGSENVIDDAYNRLVKNVEPSDELFKSIADNISLKYQLSIDSNDVKTVIEESLLDLSTRNMSTLNMKVLKKFINGKCHLISLYA